MTFRGRLRAKDGDGGAHGRDPDSQGGERAIEAQLDRDGPEEQGGGGGEQRVGRDCRNMGLQVAPRREDRQDGRVRDGGADVAEGCAAEARADAVEEVLAGAAAESLRERPHQWQHDAHRPEGGAGRKRDGVREQRDDGRQRPARQPLAQRAGEESGGADVGDDGAEGPREQQDKHRLEDLLEPLRPRGHRLVQREGPLREHEPKGRQPAGGGGPDEGGDRVAVGQDRDEREGGAGRVGQRPHLRRAVGQHPSEGDEYDRPKGKESVDRAERRPRLGLERAGPSLRDRPLPLPLRPPLCRAAGRGARRARLEL
mmetsp:Transcript_45982/g.153452  ORF Transcript_45982/g.153452 Transcript_45982/m.153452 type:complete len:313 (+) Transcript_45982:219-1157(+)